MKQQAEQFPAAAVHRKAPSRCNSTCNKCDVGGTGKAGLERARRVHAPNNRSRRLRWTRMKPPQPVPQ